MNIQRLETKIISASMKYYAGTEGVNMSDEAFDMMIDQLRTADPNHWILSTPGWGYAPEVDKVNHIGGTPVGSLGKVKHPEIKPNFHDSTVWTPKLDGMSVCLYSYNGRITAVTRGDGTVGKDVTLKTIEILKRNNPEVIENLKVKKGMWSSRGEVIVDLQYEKNAQRSRSNPP